MKQDWPPSTESPYDNPAMQQSKPGNFFTLCHEDHPAYDLFRALNGQGWTWDISSSRHWCHMRHGGRYIDFSLFGQGGFGCVDKEYREYGICLEDWDNVWSDALPHIAKFMRINSDHRADMHARAKAFAASQAAVSESGRE